jgi:hypothetical protein
MAFPGIRYDFKNLILTGEVYKFGFGSLHGPKPLKF